MKNFLRQFFGTPDITGVEPPIHESLANNDEMLTQLAKQLCDEIGGPSGELQCNRGVILPVPEPDQITMQGLPEAVTVEGDLHFLGRAKGKAKWGELIEELFEEGRDRGFDHRNWVNQLVAAIHAAKNEKLFTSGGAVFRANDYKSYLPVLEKVDDGVGRTRRFHVIFVEQQVSGSARTPDRFASLLSCLNLGTRLEFDVCAHYLDEENSWFNKPERFEEVRTRIGELIDSIETEGRARREAELSNSVKVDRLIEALRPDGEAERVEENLKAQRSLKRELTARSSGGENPISDADSLREKLHELRALNREVMLLASARYCQLLEERLPAPVPARGQPK